MSAADYEIDAVVHDGRTTRVVRARRRRDGLRVVLKHLRPEVAHLAARVDHEYAVLRRIRSPHVAAPLARDDWHGLPALVFADLGGAPLTAWIRRPRTAADLADRLRIAVGLTHALAAVHAAGVVHRDLKPSNVLVAPDGDVLLVDFSAATLAHEGQARGEGTLQYIAPEQTGRTGRAVDARSDHYALGVTLYELLTGRLPFAHDDPLALVHAHLARVPPAPEVVNPDLPPPLGAVVLKLLEKSPEARYQSLRGLRADLERCLAALASGAEIAPFVPGAADVSPELRLPDALLGRDPETARLHAALARARAGVPGLALVVGPAGAGKSALLRGAFGQGAGATVAAGKFDQAARDIPYAALAAALEQALRRRLGEPEADLAAFRHDLAAALGPAARLVCDLVPALALLLGPQPPPPEVPPAESAARFAGLMLRLVQRLAAPTRPLALVLDDLQWSDASTLQLVARLLTGGEIPHLLVVGAVRDDEPAPPVDRLVLDLRAAGVAVDAFALAPLTPAEIAELAAPALAWTPAQAAALAGFVHARTLGNPLFVRAVLRWLHEQGHLRFDPAAGAWTFDALAAAAAGPGDDLGALLTRELARLSPDARAALELAACLGDRFAHRRLAAVLGAAPEAVADTLHEAMERGLVRPVGVEDLGPGLGAEVVFEFAHDRVRQAAHALADEPRRRALHLRIVLERLAAPVDGDALFVLLGHAARAGDLLVDPGVRLRLAGHALTAARRAAHANAHAAAAGYARQGRALLPADAWTAHYPLTFALHRTAMECEQLAGDVDAADAAFAPLRTHARDDLDLGEVYALRVGLDSALERYRDAIAAARAGLTGLGVALPERAGRPAFLRELAAIRWQRGLRPLAELARLPAAEDPRLRLILRLLTRLAVAAYFEDEALMSLALLRAVALSIRHGVTDDSAVAFAVWAALLLHELADPDAAGEVVDVALALADRFPSPTTRVRIANYAGIFVLSWLRPHAARALLTPQVDQALALGNAPYATYLAAGLLYNRWLADEPLPDIQSAAEELHRIARHTPGWDHKHWFLPVARACLALRGLTDRPDSWDGPDFSEHALVTGLGPQHLGTGFSYQVFKLVHLYHLGDHDAAAAVAARLRRLRSGGHPLLAELVFMRLLVRCAQAPARPLTAADRPALHRWRDRLRLWARACPERFAARAELAAAELARAEDQPGLATPLYHRAIEAARAAGLLRIEALALERAALHLRAVGSPALSDMYLRAAREAYARWGATVVVDRLAGAPPTPPPAPPPARPRDTTTSDPGALDVEALLRASQAIAGEIELEKLLRTLLRTVLEVAGARRGAVLLPQPGGELRVEALAVADGEPEVLHARTPADAGLPAAPIHYVARTGQDLILADAARSEFADEPGVAGLRSLLCAPILHHGALTGVLWLDNDLAAGCFGAARTALLRQLAAQVAVSIENARLYRGLAQARDAAVSADRTKTRFLMNMSHELRTPLNAVLGYAELIEESIADGELAAVPADLARIRQSAQRLLRTLANILELTRLEADAVHPARAPVDLAELVRAVLADAEALARGHGNAVALDLPPLPPARTDRALLHRALLALVDNALRFTAGGRVELAAATYLSHGTPWCALRVRDTGIGIAAADLPRLFRSFGQLDDAPTRSFEGTGVSLAVARRLVELLGGRITVESEPGRGSTFTIHLPIDAP
jgi:predicted ATPase/signal transduction histidine kinase